jgi:diacylglycerol kinase (ATP)
LEQKKNIVFILNPISGTRKKKLVPDLLRKHLNHAKYAYEIAETARPLHAQELAKAAAEAGAHIVVAVGGDGTVNEVASGLLYSSTALGILPFGSGNGLARHLGIPMDTVEAIQLLNEPAFSVIDGAEANGKPFFCTAGLGFDAHIGRLFATTHTRGFASYIRISMQEYFRFKPDFYSIRTNGQLLEGEYFVLTMANAGQYGNNAYISPKANIRDGLIDLCLLQPFPHYESIRLGWQLFNKRIHKSPYLKIIRTTEAEISAPSMEYMHLDGEFITLKGKLLMRMLPKSLKVVVPG